MICNRAKVLLALLLCGLCTATQANTTAAGSGIAVVAQAGSSGVPLWTAQNDIALPPVQGPDRATVSPRPGPRREGPTRIVLLLPLRSATLGPAAEAVRAGFVAAYERETEGVLISVIGTDGSVPDALSGYVDAIAGNDIVIGPLSRSEVTALAQSGRVGKPTVALAHPDAGGDAELALPPQMLAVGLSIEEEARQAANWIGADKSVARAFIVSTSVAWQRRAAKAFAAQWRAQGGEPQSMELSVSDGYLSPSSLVQLKKRLQADRPDLLFTALDAGLTAQLRLSIGADMPIYGTSQLNPLALSDWELSEPRTDMDGVRLLDIPWQLQADHPAVMTYPHLVVSDDQKRSADLERLYALGIDAYRIAREIASNNTHFAIDGVTGKLRVDFGRGANRFERIEQPAVYRDGKVAPLDAEQ